MAKPAWKKFEEDVEAYFKKRMEQEPIIYHRFYDTHSAGSFLPAQPGDHLIKTLNHTILLETKHSEIHPSLKSCFSAMVDDNQIAHLRLWMRAGAVGLIMFKGTRGIEIWEAGHCIYCRLNGRHLNPSHILKLSSSIKHAFTNLELVFPDTATNWKLL